MHFFLCINLHFLHDIFFLIDCLSASLFFELMKHRKEFNAVSKNLSSLNYVLFLVIQIHNCLGKGLFIISNTIAGSGDKM